MIDKVKKLVFELLERDNSGHGIDHIDRVLNISLKFAEVENANKEIVALIALLHDVDDYKLFGIESEKNLYNATKIMDNVEVDEKIKHKVLESLHCIGYSNLLKGFRPNSLEGMIVSDADMCDAMGVNGIIRTHIYSLKNGKPFFDKNLFPIEEMTAEKYTRKCADSSVCHIFEKVLKLKYLMMTESGKKEAEKRNQIIIDVLYELFREEDAKDWTVYMDNYLENQKKLYKNN